MSDWRSAPRNGKAAFMAHLDTIQAQLAKGHTHKAIYEALVASQNLVMSQSQFNRYVKALVVGNAQPRHAAAKAQAVSETAQPATGIRRFVHNPTPPANLLE
jgi:Family of unknown function (DUF5338)